MKGLCSSQRTTHSRDKYLILLNVKNPHHQVLLYSGSDPQQITKWLSTVKDLNYTSSCKVMIWTIVWSRDCEIQKNSTWKYKIMVHTKPSTIEGLPSAISVEFMLTSLICIEKKACYYHTQRTATLKCISKRVCIWNAFLQSNKILNSKTQILNSAISHLDKYNCTFRQALQVMENF